MRRRDFMPLSGAAVMLPLAARAQQAMPVIGYVNSLTPDPAYLAGFHRGLGEMGYVEDNNIVIEYRWAQNDFGRLPALLSDLVRRQVAVIVADGYGAAFAAKDTTAPIPVVFATGGNPVEAGLVASLNRPGGNLTGITNMGVEVAPKRFGLLHDLLPRSKRFAVLINQTSPNSEALIREARAAGAAIGREIEILAASNNREVDKAFDDLLQKQADALLVSPNTFLYSRRVQIVTLAAYHRLPAIYSDHSFAEIGGLMSYGTDIRELGHQVGIYTGRILKGAKPADLPVIQLTKFEFVLNLQTAKTFGLTVPPSLLALTDEVIE